MDCDTIAEIEIDESGRLLVKPKAKTFPLIYREAMEVHWESNGSFLFSPPPRKQNYLWWFLQIISAAEQQSCKLHISTETTWKNIPSELKNEITAKAVQNA